MDASDLPPLPGTITVRVGCELAYEAEAPASVLLLVKPQLASGQFIIDEYMEFGAATATPAAPATPAAVEEARDHHGNAVLRAMLMPGRNEFRHEAVIVVPREEDNRGLPTQPAGVESLPLDVLRYTFPSRYCESDQLTTFARQKFGRLPHGIEQVRAVCDWVHANIEYRYGSGSQSISASDAIVRGYGVCRDFAHVMLALCRALDLPARYAAGYLPHLDGDIADQNAGCEGGSDIGIDFHAYVEVYLGGCWHTFDARYNRPMMGRIKIAHGMDAVDAAFATIYGDAAPVGFRVWSHQVAPSAAAAGRAPLA